MAQRAWHDGCHSSARGGPARDANPPPSQGVIMAKYLVAWLLGVPAFVLVLLYLFFH